MVPAVLFAAVSGTAFALAKLHPAKPEPRSGGGGTVVLGDAYNGQLIFEQTCSGCHGQGGEGGGVGPRLKDNPISLAQAKATIETGRGAMPGGLVSGRRLNDVLAYLATIVGKG